MAVEEYSIDTPATLHLSDEILTRQALAGSQRAFTLLVKRYEKPLFEYVNFLVRDNQCADDIVQWTFFQLYSNLSVLDTSRPLRSWLYCVAHRRSIDKIRSSQRRRKHCLYFSELGYHYDTETSEEYITDPALLDSAPQPEEAAELHEQMAHLQQAIQDLPSPFRDIIFLHYYQQCSLKKIAQLLSMPPGTVKVYCHRAKHRLRSSFNSTSACTPQ